MPAGSFDAQRLFGMRHVKIEDMVAITDTGSELLSPAGREWQLSIP